MSPPSPRAHSSSGPPPIRAPLSASTRSLASSSTQPLSRPYLRAPPPGCSMALSHWPPSPSPLQPPYRPRLHAAAPPMSISCSTHRATIPGLPPASTTPRAHYRPRSSLPARGACHLAPTPLRTTPCRALLRPTHEVRLLATSSVNGRAPPAPSTKARAGHPHRCNDKGPLPAAHALCEHTPPSILSCLTSRMSSGRHGPYARSCPTSTNTITAICCSPAKGRTRLYGSGRSITAPLPRMMTRW